MENNNYADMIKIMQDIKLSSLVNGVQLNNLYGLAWFKSHYTDTAIYLDTGTNVGNSAIVMASALKHQKLPKPVKVYTVDDFQYGDFNYDSSVDRDSAIAKAKYNLSQFGIDDIIEFHVENDLDFINSLPDHTLDMVFDDSGHTYKETFDRLCAYIPKMNDNSLILVHDYYVNFYPVIKAVNDFKKRFSDIVVEYGVIEGMSCLLCNVTTDAKGGK
jgi:predicted O-methyltransferase YrrM